MLNPLAYIEALANISQSEVERAILQLIGITNKCSYNLPSLILL